VVVYEL
jgi:hypothetical protein